MIQRKGCAHRYLPDGALGPNHAKCLPFFLSVVFLSLAASTLGLHIVGGLCRGVLASSQHFSMTGLFGTLQEMSRLQHAISLRCLVVSQRSLEPDLDAEWGDKLVIADDEDIPRQLKHYLDHPREREARVEKAYRHSKENYRLEDWLRKSTFLKHYMGTEAGMHPSEAPIRPSP